MTQHVPALPFNHIQRGPRSTRFCIARLLICLVCLSISLPYVAPAQTIAPAPLPPAAQQALDKGIIAARGPDYLLAIRFFEEARKIVPKAPVIYLNLGLAESRIPGRELRAIAWFGAYLAANPDTLNAAAVKEQIAVLDVRNRSNVSRLIKAVQDAASQMPKDTRLPTMGRDREHILYQAAKLQARFGDIEGAQKTAELIVASAMWQDFAYEAIAGAQFEADDIAGASQTAARIHDKDKKQAIQKAIAEAAGTTKPANKAAVEVGDWLRQMGVGTWQHGASDRSWIVGPLTTDMFLDLGGYLKSLPPASKSIHAYFWALQETADKIVIAQKTIDQMLKQRTTR